MRASIFARGVWRRHRRDRLITGAAIAATLTASGFGAAWSQERPTIAPEDYGRWENLGRAALSPDGAWLAYGVEMVDEQAELRIRSLERDSMRSVPWGRNPAFAPDGRWLAWAVGVSPDEEERLQKAEEPVRLGVGLLDLASGEERSFEEVRGFGFDSSARFLALHGYAPEEPKGKGADLRVVDLAEGTTTTFGNVAEFAWSDSASLLALAVSTGGEEGNGVQVYDADSGRIRSLGTSGSAYRQLAWREGGADLAVLRSREPASEEDATAHDALAWRGLDGEEPSEFALTAGAAGLADSLEVVRHAAPRWSDDGRLIAIGLRPAEPEEEPEDDEGTEEDAGERTDTEGESPEDAEGDAPQDSTAAEDDEPELPGLQIWHSSDRRIFARQQASQDSDERRTLLSVWHLDEARVVQIGTDQRASAQLLEGWTRAIEQTQEPYAWGEMFGRPYSDTWVVDVGTGEREQVLERVRYNWTSAGGRWLVAFDGSNYTSLDLQTGARYDLTSELPTVFADTAYDTPTDVLPPHGFGPGGWLENDEAVFLYDEHDIWRVSPDGSGATRLTRGLEEDITHRIVREFDPSRGEFRTLGDDDDEPGFDPAQPIYLSLYGERTEKRGYARLVPATDDAVGGQGDESSIERLVYEDKRISGLTKADSADVYMFNVQAFDDPPDLFVAGPDLSDARQVTDINPFISEYAWGRAELVDFVSEGGRDLQAVLLYPASYSPGERVPMIVYTYEMLSPQIHFFSAPNERRYYNFTAWTQQGYAVLLPDIVYRARDPGISALESVRAAVARIVELGVADADRVGLIGHSWGGYQATFLPTRTDIFAASVAGAPLTDFVSFMGAIHWNPGVPEVDHWETGQARMEVPFWDDPEAHRRNSPIHMVHEMETPLLMAFGNEDGVVDWDQGTEFYNFARRAGKQMVLLVYEGEDHGFRQEANQVDYHRRILEWFGHYLKGEPAPDWITEGIPLDELEDEARRVATKQGG
jgi:dipeptidyl aminopeptidase/acylaminoacyl peptidase